MNRLDMDFAAARVRPPLVAWAMLVAGMAAAAWVALTYQTAQEEHAALEARVAAFRHDTSDVRSRRRDENQEARDAALTAAQGRLAMPWAQLLATLQAQRNRDIGFISLDADGRQGRLDLTAEARTYAAMLDFYRRMRHAEGVADVNLVQHEAIQVENALPIRFVLRLRWGAS